MKNVMISCFAGLVISCANVSDKAQDFKEHISKEFSLKTAAPNSTLAIYNVFGNIRVEGYPGDKVMIEIDKAISGKNAEQIELGKKEFKLEFEEKSDSIIVYTAEPYDSRPNRNWTRKNENRNVEYKIQLDFVVKIPKGMNIRVITINDGNVSVKDVEGTLDVGNVNGNITIENAKGTSKVHTVNGNVDVTYLSSPPEKSTYNTINGTMNITYPADLSADIQLKSMNGEFFTDFSDAQILPGSVVKNTDKKDGGTTYKLEKDTSLRIGKGGKVFRFETLNGNIYIKKQS